MRYAVVALSALALVLTVQSLGRAEPPAGAPRWEYRRCCHLDDPAAFEALFPEAKGMQAAARKQIETLGIEIVPTERFRQFLAAAGADGWELICVYEKSWVFKRPLK